MLIRYTCLNGFQLSSVTSDGRLQAQIKSVADGGVAKGDLIEPGNLLAEIGEVLQAEVMTGIDAQA